MKDFFGDKNHTTHSDYCSCNLAEVVPGDIVYFDDASDWPMAIVGWEQHRLVVQNFICSYVRYSKNAVKALITADGRRVKWMPEND